MTQAMERLRDAMETEEVLMVRRVVFSGKTVGFRVELEDGREAAAFTPREAITLALAKPLAQVAA